MSDKARDVIARQLSASGYDNGQQYGKLAADILAALKAERIAAVELPELMGDRSVVAESIRNQPMWALNDAWAAVNEDGEIELEADGQDLYGTLGTARDARDLAAVLLAAANEAEGCQR